MGAAKGNTNAMKAGSRVMNLGNLPRKCIVIKRTVNAMRRQIEQVLLERDGEIALYKAALVQSACRHEAAALLQQRWLRLPENENLDINEKTKLLAGIQSSTDRRDRCLEKLKLDTIGDESEAWAGLTIDSGAEADDSSSPAGQGQSSGQDDTTNDHPGETTTTTIENPQ